MDQPLSPVTIDDVAARAGVSKATVSRVVNGNSRVREDLRQRVMAAIADLGYQPDRTARRLRVQSSEILGIIIPDIQNPFFTSVVRGIEDIAYEQQMNVLLCNTDDNPQKQENYLRVMMAERVAGLVLVPSFGIRSQAMHQLQQAGIPVVLIDRLIENGSFDSVTVDNYQGAYNATQHLIGLGYERIAFIGGDLELTPGKERYRGYKQALADHNMALDPELVRIEHFKIESGQRLMHELLAAPPCPDAVFSASNLLSLGIFKAVRERGLRLPQDIAVVGFDDMPWASELYAPLTTVAQPTYQIGQEAVRLLLQRRSNPDAPIRSVTLNATLVIRETCGAQLVRGGDVAHSL